MANRWSSQQSTGAAQPPKPWSPARTGPSNQRDNGDDGREALSAGQQALRIKRVQALLERAAGLMAHKRSDTRGYLTLVQLDTKRRETAIARRNGKPGKKNVRVLRIWLSRLLNALSSPTGKLSFRLRLYLPGGMLMDNVSFTIHIPPTPEPEPPPVPTSNGAAERAARTAENQALAERVATQEVALSQATQTIASLQTIVTDLQETVQALEGLAMKDNKRIDDIIRQLQNNDLLEEFRRRFLQ